jgi:hypothetical protein
MDIKQYASLDDAVRAVIAINVSDRGGKQNKGELVFTTATETGKIDIRLPDTWIPVDLSKYASIDDIAKSNDLRNLMRKGLVILIPAEQSKTIEQHPNYAKELSRVNERISKRDVLGSLTDSTSDTFTLNVGGVSSSIQAPLDLPESVNVSGKQTTLEKVRKKMMDDLISFCENADKLDISDKIQSLPALNTGDFQYVIESVGNRRNPIYSIAIEAVSFPPDTAFDIKTTEWYASN